MRAFLLLVFTMLTLVCNTDANARLYQKPGISIDLWVHTFYACTKNYYVSTAGSDTASGTSADPWLTLQHANDVGHVSGDCINVATGTYDGVNITSGGNAASATGYVSWRCSNLGKCIVRGNAGPNGADGFRFPESSPWANYVVIDGFKIVGTHAAYGAGVYSWNGGNESGANAPVANHHIWVLNSDISGFAQSGIAINDAEWIYALHNVVHGNSNDQCDAQGSGIAYTVFKTVPNYTPTTDDMSNWNAQVGSWKNGASIYHNAIMWNVVYNNALTKCGTAANPYDTDGNGIILDTFLKVNGNSVDYPASSLVAKNLVFNNGGGGIHIFFSANATVLNNTCFNNYLDPFNQGSFRACLDENQGYNTTFKNNIAVAMPVKAGCNFGVAPYAMFNAALLGSPANIAGAAPDSFGNNMTYIGSGTASCWASYGQDAPTGEVDMSNSDTGKYSSGYFNVQSKNPLWMNVGPNMGDENTPPTNTNFALSPGSPAIGLGYTGADQPQASGDLGACSSHLTSCP